MSAIWNPSDKDNDLTLSNGYLTATNTGASVWGAVRTVVSKSAGKHYFEIEIDDEVNQHSIGIATSAHALNIGVGYNTTAGYSYWYNGKKYYNSASGVAFGDTYTVGDIIGVAIDLDAGKIWFAKNNAWQDSGDPGAGTGEAFSGISGTFFPVYSTKNNTAAGTASFSSADQTYAPPAGFSAFESAVGLFDGKARIKDSGTDVFDGRTFVYSDVTDKFDGKARVKDSTTGVFDGKVWLYPARNLFDGKVWIKELIEGSVDLPFLDITGNTGGIGDITLPFFEVLGEVSVGIDAQGNLTLPGFGVVGFTGANCRYDLPSLGISGMSVVGIAASGDVVLPIFGVNGQAFTDAIVNGVFTLPALTVVASSIAGALCIGKVTLPAFSVGATTKIGTICTGAVILPCLIVEGTGGHIPVGDGDITLPLLQVYSTASILADPRDGCHVLRYNRWR